MSFREYAAGRRGANLRIKAAGTVSYGIFRER